MRTACAVMLVGMAAMIGAGRMEAQETGKLAAAPLVTYRNRYEVYGGINYMNFQAGQSVAKLMNLGGAEVSGTYWITDRIGAVLDYRGEAGTSPVRPNSTFNGNALVYMNMGMLGAQYRVAQNQRGAFALHALAGAAHGVFDTTLPSAGPGTSTFGNSGFYNNKTKPIAAIGGSVDLNRSKNFAIRLSPDLILEHFGTETREFFAIGGGVIYRFGSR